MQCCMSMAIDFFFLLFASLFLFAPLCTLCQHRYARPTVYSTPPCVWVRACWLWGRWGVRREEDCPTVSHDIITCRNFFSVLFSIFTRFKCHGGKPLLMQTHSRQSGTTCSHLGAQATTQKNLSLFLSSYPPQLPGPLLSSPGTTWFWMNQLPAEEKAACSMACSIIQHNILSKRGKKRTQGKKREKKERWGGEGGRRVCDKEEVEMVWQGESEKEKRKKEDGVEKVLGPHHQWIITRLIVRQRN